VRATVGHQRAAHVRGGVRHHAADQPADALAAAGTSVAQVGVEKLGQTGVLYHGLQVLGGGAILSSLVLGSMAAFLIEREYVKASAFALAGALLTFFGFMHGEAIGIAQTPLVALSHVLVAAVIYGCRYATTPRRRRTPGSNRKRQRLPRSRRSKRHSFPRGRLSSASRWMSRARAQTLTGWPAAAGPALTPAFAEA
jgi:hypothetical protein